MITYAGEVPVSAALPVLAQLVAAFDVEGLQGQIKALAAITLNFRPPSVAGTIAFAAKLGAAASVAIVPPAVDISGQLLVKLGLLKAKLALLLQIKALLTGGSVRVYEYSGPAGDFGPELGGALGDIPTQNGTVAVVFLAEAGSAGATTLAALRGGVSV